MPVRYRSVYLKDGAISNQHGGTMSDVNVGGTAGVVINDGSLGRFGIGVVMASGGIVANGADGALTWVRIGVGGGECLPAPIRDRSPAGLSVCQRRYRHGVVVNEAGATIANEVYIAGIGSHGTVTNAGIDRRRDQAELWRNDQRCLWRNNAAERHRLAQQAATCPVTNYGVISGVTGADVRTN